MNEENINVLKTFKEMMKDSTKELETKINREFRDKVEEEKNKEKEKENETR